MKETDFKIQIKKKPIALDYKKKFKINHVLGNSTEPTVTCNRQYSITKERVSLEDLFGSLGSSSHIMLLQATCQEKRKKSLYSYFLHMKRECLTGMPEHSQLFCLVFARQGR